jgi:hypothetical protein
MTRIARLCSAVLLAAIATVASAAVAPREFLGHEIGQRFTSHEKIVGYFEQLQRESPLLRVRQYGESWEGRPLIQAIVASEENHRALASLQEMSLALSRPDRTSRTRAEEIARTLPVVVWLAFGVHGNESSSSEAALLVAHRLLSGDDEARAILDKAIVVIDPLQNPDGRERYIQWFRRTRGLTPNPNPEAAEHLEPWPGGRYNHYLIDMNRDWAFPSQRETLARIEAMKQWNPHVVVDFHEMGYESSYFFPPVAAPVNLNVSEDIEQWFEIFGKGNAEAFAANGWPFFVAERYDFFYPGYGDIWPTLHGAVGMTYEMGGSGRAGLAVRREDGSTLTLGDRAERHYTTAMATLRTAAAHRHELVMRTWQTLQTKMEDGRVVYVIPPSNRNFNAALQTLRTQGIRVDVLTSPARIRVSPYGEENTSVRDFPAGTALVNTRQPLGGLVQSLMEKAPVIEQTFLSSQREKIEADESDDFYDITAWSLPISHNLEVWVSPAAVEAQFAEWSPPAPPTPPPAAKFGYLIDGMDPAVYRAAGSLLDEGVKFSVSESSFSHGGRSYSRGSLLVLRGNNAADIDQKVRRSVTETGVTATPITSAWEGGLALGSHRLRHVREPRIALVGGEGTAATSFGMLWFALDVDQRVPHTVLPLNRLRSTNLSHYRVLILPDGSGYNSALGEEGREKLKAWVRAGGTVIAVGGAGGYLRSKDVAISKLRLWPGEEEDEEKETDAPEEPKRYNEYRIPGAAFRTEMNERSYLTFGLERSPAVLLEGTTVLVPLEHKVDNIITVRKESPLVSGFAWPESLERIAGAVYVAEEPFGSGRVITFADEPYFRLFWRGTLPVLMNAALYSPSFDRD